MVHEAMNDLLAVATARGVTTTLKKADQVDPRFSNLHCQQNIIMASIFCQAVNNALKNFLGLTNVFFTERI
jgi:hypothetical protein